MEHTHRTAITEIENALLYLQMLENTLDEKYGIIRNILVILKEKADRLLHDAAIAGPSMALTSNSLESLEKYGTGKDNSIELCFRNQEYELHLTARISACGLEEESCKLTLVRYESPQDISIYDTKSRRWFSLKEMIELYESKKLT